LIQKNDAQQPKIDPKLPAANGRAIPIIELFKDLLFVPLLFFGVFKAGEAGDKLLVERSARTSDAGKKILQHKLYNI
jgi:hypothetical protein